MFSLLQSMQTVHLPLKMTLKFEIFFKELPWWAKLSHWLSSLILIHPVLKQPPGFSQILCLSVSFILLYFNTCLGPVKLTSIDWLAEFYVNFTLLIFQLPVPKLQNVLRWGSVSYNVLGFLLTMKKPLSSFPRTGD